MWGRGRERRKLALVPSDQTNSLFANRLSANSATDRRIGRDCGFGRLCMCVCANLRGNWRARAWERAARAGKLRDRGRERAGASLNRQETVYWMRPLRTLNAICFNRKSCQKSHCTLFLCKFVNSRPRIHTRAQIHYRAQLATHIATMRICTRCRI